jgi:hypothetical protein
MKFKVCFSTLLVAVITVLSIISTGCSTLSEINPFTSHQSEDYNALAYGDDYKDTTRDDHSWVSDSDARSTRRPASISDNGNSSDPQDQSAQDPTNDRVRQRIETNRGLAIDTYAKGDRATRSDFLDNAPNDGSLWSNQIDANYFFTKGKVRAMGDIVSVKMEDPMIRQLADEIKKSLSPAEQEVEMALYLKNSAEAKDNKDVSAYRNIAADDLKTSAAEDVKQKMEKSVRWSQVNLSGVIGVTPNEELRAEIIDRFQNGNYKLRLTKRVMYRGSSKLVSMVAVAPQNDFDDKDLIASGKLYEYKIKVAR